MSWPAVTLEFNVAQLFSPLLLIVVGWLVNSAKNALMRHMDENRDKAHDLAEKRHKENVERFDRIERQTTETNGKVAAHDVAITVLQTKAEMLTDLYLKSQPDKGN